MGGDNAGPIALDAGLSRQGTSTKELAEPLLFMQMFEARSQKIRRHCASCVPFDGPQLSQKGETGGTVQDGPCPIKKIAGYAVSNLVLSHPSTKECASCGEAKEPREELVRRTGETVCII